MTFSVHQLLIMDINVSCTVTAHHLLHMVELSLSFKFSTLEWCEAEREPERGRKAPEGTVLQANRKDKMNGRDKETDTATPI